MNVIPLSGFDLAMAAAIVLLLAVVSNAMRLGIGKQMIWSGFRMTLQLLLIGMVLRQLFQDYTLWLVIGLSLIMVLIAGREIRIRQKIKTKNYYDFSIGVISMFLSSFAISIFALAAIIQVDPWYTPQYAIPLLGMLLGNTMTGISLSIDTLTTQINEKRNIVEQRLYLGETWQQASDDIRKNAMRTGMIPIINSMAAAGLVSLPGTMTGQILGGTPPLEAVKYQILILFLIAAGTGFGVISAIWLTNKNLFDSRHRLCLEKLDLR